MTQPPDDAALVAGSPATDSRGNFVIPNATDLLKRMHNATERTIGIGRGIRDMRDSSRTVPITVRELRYVEQMVSDAATALEAKDRRIAGMQEAGERLLLAMTTRALRGRDHVPSMRDEQDAASAFRAALEPSDKGVGR